MFMTKPHTCVRVISRLKLCIDIFAYVYYTSLTCMVSNAHLWKLVGFWRIIKETHSAIVQKGDQSMQYRKGFTLDVQAKKTAPLIAITETADDTEDIGHSKR